MKLIVATRTGQCLFDDILDIELRNLLFRSTFFGIYLSIFEIKTAAIAKIDEKRLKIGFTNRCELVIRKKQRYEENENEKRQVEYLMLGDIISLPA